jgi:nicotinate-nucleotide adenylyltransferase
VSADVAGDSERPATATAQVGLLGGTFDPIHVGHVALALAARRELGLDEVIVVPAGQPPHKASVSITPAADRLAMVELAIDGADGLTAGRIEIDRAGPSFTVDTVQGLLDRARDAGRDIELTVILSADAFAGLPTWHEPARLLRLARIAVGPRPGHARPSIDDLPAELLRSAVGVAILDGPNVDVSGTEIRGRVAAGLSIEGLVAPAVAIYIEEHHLYRQPSDSEDAT